MTANAQIVRKYIEAVTRFDDGAVGSLLHPDMHFHELPNRIRPAGGVDDLSVVMAGLRRAKEGKVLTAQRYIIGDVIEAGDRVVMEARWEGDLAIPVGKLAMGNIMVAHLCMVFRLKDGRIIEQRNYDCYEDFNA
ncbi:MAG: nuclear transport factor 2 family protein [Devosia sp.]